MKKLFFHLGIFLFFGLVFSLSINAVSAANLDFAAPSAAGNLNNVTANSLFRFIINVLIILGIVISLIFLLWGGIRWILSGGDKGKVDAARSTIVASIVGLIIVILAYVIINTVLTLLTGNGINGFHLPNLSDPEGKISPGAAGQ